MEPDCGHYQPIKLPSEVRHGPRYLIFIIGCIHLELKSVPCIVVDAIEDTDEDREEGVETEVVEFVANDIMYTVQTTNTIKVGGNWEGPTAVHISTRPSDHR